MSTRSATTQAKTQARKAAQDLLQARMRPITKLAELGAEVDAARDALEAARERLRATQESYAEGYRSARDAGWSPTELDAVGYGTQPAGAALRAGPRRSGVDESGSDDGAELTGGSGGGEGVTVASPTDGGTALPLDSEHPHAPMS